MNIQHENELTTETFWSGVWETHLRRRARASWLRRKLKAIAVRHSDRMFRKLVSLTGCSSCDLLEIGCAPGATLEEIHRACPTIRLHGIDYSEFGLEMARHRLAPLRIEATLHFGDVFNARLPQRYDIVLSTGVIEHFIDPIPMIQAHARLAKPSGHVVVTVPNCASWAPNFCLRKFDPELLAAHNVSIMSEARLRELMEQAGLVDVHVGKAGPPHLHERAAAGKKFGNLYANLAKSWNRMVYLLPAPPIWRACYWAVGRVPAQHAMFECDH